MKNDTPLNDHDSSDKKSDMCKPSIESIREELGKRKKTLELKWNSLIKIKNYDTPKELGDLKKMGQRGLFPTVRIAYKDIQDITDCKQFLGEKFLFLKEDKEIILKDFIDILFNLKQLNKFVSYNCISQNIHKAIKRALICEMASAKKIFDDVLNEILENIISEIIPYRFCKILQGIKLKDTNVIKFYDVEIFNFETSNIKFELNKNEIDFLKKDFEGKICIRCDVTGEYNFANELAIKKFKTVINCIRFLIWGIRISVLKRQFCHMNTKPELHVESQVEFILRVGITTKEIIC